LTDHELIALAVAQVITGLVSDRQFLGTIGLLLPGFFPDLPGQSQFNRRLRRLTASITAVQFEVAELVASGRVRLLDGTLLSCANYAGCGVQKRLRRVRQLRLLRREEPVVLGMGVILR
jgi:hypothetical protein